MRSALLMGILFFGSAATAAPEVPPPSEEEVRSAADATRLALNFLFETTFTESAAEGLLASGGAVAREGVDFWTVTITRIDLEFLETPRMAAVDRVTGKVRPLVPQDHLRGGAGPRLIPEMRPWGL